MIVEITRREKRRCASLFVFVRKLETCWAQEVRAHRQSRVWGSYLRHSVAACFGFNCKGCQLGREKQSVVSGRGAHVMFRRGTAGASRIRCLAVSKATTAPGRLLCREVLTLQTSSPKLPKGSAGDSSATRGTLMRIVDENALDLCLHVYWHSGSNDRTETFPELQVAAGKSCLPSPPGTADDNVHAIDRPCARLQLERIEPNQTPRPHSLRAGDACAFRAPPSRPP